MKKINKLLIAVLAVAGLSLPLAANTYAADPFCDESLRGTPVWDSMGCGQTAEAANKTFSDTVIGIINAVLAVIGIVAVVFVIYGGFLYLTSAGDASKVKKGKDTLMYALIGLVIVGLAFAIVNFVINNLINV
jgi:hypothetical protein